MSADNQNISVGILFHQFSPCGGRCGLVKVRRTGPIQVFNLAGMVDGVAGNQRFLTFRPYMNADMSGRVPGGGFQKHFIAYSVIHLHKVNQASVKHRSHRVAHDALI